MEGEGVEQLEVDGSTSGGITMPPAVPVVAATLPLLPCCNAPLLSAASVGELAVAMLLKLSSGNCMAGSSEPGKPMLLL